MGGETSTRRRSSSPGSRPPARDVGVWPPPAASSPSVWPGSWPGSCRTSTRPRPPRRLPSPRLPRGPRGPGRRARSGRAGPRRRRLDGLRRDRRLRPRDLEHRRRAAGAGRGRRAHRRGRDGPVPRRGIPVRAVHQLDGRKPRGAKRDLPGHERAVGRADGQSRCVARRARERDSTAPTPQERAASDRASARWKRAQQAYRDCGLYTITGIHDAAVAECIERRTS